MARVNVDAAVRSDPRFRILARNLGLPLAHALGHVLLVWFACYERREAVLPEDEIDTAAELEGFGAALVEARLAERQPDGIWVRGVERRIGYLKGATEAGRRGGKMSGAARRKKKREEEETKGRRSDPSFLTTKGAPEGGAEGGADKIEGGARRGAPDCQMNLLESKGLRRGAEGALNPLTPDTLPAHDTTPAGKPADGKGRQSKTTPDSPAWSRVVDAYFTLYRKRTGEDPARTGSTWGPLRQCLDAAGGDADIVIRRMGNLFNAPPAFLREGTPDAKTLLGFWDRLAAPVRAQGWAPPARADQLPPAGVYDMAEARDRFGRGNE
jgi:hypothetical protein